MSDRLRILVTGGAGYVGSVTVERLVEAGHEVVVLDDLSTGHAAAVVDGAQFVRGSYADESATTALLRMSGIQAVLHCAARSLVAESIAEPARYYRANVAGGIALLEAARAAGVGRFVFSSTAAVYGTPDATPISEDAPLHPINPYGETKRTVETMLRWYGAAYGLRSVSLRYFNVAGASERNGEVHSPETHLIPIILAAAATRGAVTIFGDDYPTADGTCVRDYIHVADLADAHLAAIEATAPGDARTDEAVACNLGTAAGFSVREVLVAAEAVVGRPILERTGPRRAGDPPVLVASNARARTLLDWSPRRSSLEEMIGSAWRWRAAHPDGYAA
ncbi:MAG TPA: UDP-glucose 4-epimerase GalE [Candidatus Limnocylindrales bacterium]|nr:UDP-glucose 4-epimerase GalE [Candidatus Limnocylindrales bacterium]